jgi:damage-control phosphatase, subfamily I
MKTYLDCIPCLIRQALHASRMVSADPVLHASILRQVLHWAGDMDLQQSPPVMAQRIHRLLRTICGDDDPYRAAKDHQNRMALRLLSDLEADRTAARDPLEAAVRLAIAGNVIDLGIDGTVTEADLHESVRRVEVESLAGDLEEFREAVSKARSILYLADNAGEIVFDRLLVEQLGPARVTLAVRGFPILNDATREDARAAGLDEIVPVIDNGSDVPGTLLKECSAEFLRHFEQVDLIVAKGQGNFETLSDEPRNIFFLFKVKCPVVADHTGLPLGTHVLRRFGP